jgi:hypothetical protein
MTTKVKGTEGIEFPDATVQATAALTAFIGSNQSLAQSGYQKLPGGLIVQWGRQTLNAVANNWNGATYSFPIAFPNAGLAIVGSVSNNATLSTTVINTSLGISNNSQYGISVIAAANINGAVVQWIAIGY